MHSRVLVTGASGFIGSHLVEALVARGADVHCLVRPGRETPHLDGVRQAIHIHHADLTDRAAVTRAVRAALPEVVLHLAAAGVTDVHVDPALAVRVNVEGALNLLAALDGGYRVFVNTGTCHEYGDNEPPFREDQDPRPALPYAITKTAVWHFCRRFYQEHGWPIVTVRLFAVYGPRQPEQTFIPACIRAAQQGVVFRMTGGEQRRDFLYVTDAVAGLIRAASAPEAVGGTFNLCSGSEVTLYEVAQTIVACMGNRIAIERGALPYREGEIRRLVGDNTRARQVLGWTPQVSLEEGLRQTIETIR